MMLVSLNGSEAADTRAQDVFYSGEPLDVPETGREGREYTLGCVGRIQGDKSIKRGHEC